MSLEIQLEGAILFSELDSSGDPLTGAEVEFGAEITSLLITRSRAQVTKPATFANAQQRQRAGSESFAVAVNFFHDETLAASFTTFLWDAMDTNASEVYFRARLKPGAMGAGNPEFRGYLMIGDLDAGGTVGDLKAQSKTFAARDVTRHVS